MRWSLAASSLIHAAILIAAIVVLPSPAEYEVEEQESIPVDIVDIDEISARQSVSKDAEPQKPQEKPAPPKVEEAEKPKPAPEPAKEVKEAVRQPEPEPAPPAPEPLKELIEAAAADPEATPEPEPDPEPKKAEAQPVPVPKKKPAPPKKVVQKPKPEFNADELSALLNKIDGPKQAPPKPSEVAGQPKLAEFTSLAGTDDRISADAIDWLRQRIERCWNPPVGVREAHNLVVKLRIELQQSGEVKGVPAIMNASADPLFDVAAASAVRAVLACQPYDGLPPEKYLAWRDIILNFDPRRMLAIN